MPKYSSKFSRKDFTVQQHIVLLCLKIKPKQRYREFCDLLTEMPNLCGFLGLGKIPHKEFLKKHKFWNFFIDTKLYHKRSLSESVNSVIKRRYSDTLFSKNRRSQFKEMTLLAVVYNVDRKLMEFLKGFYKAGFIKFLISFPHMIPGISFSYLSRRLSAYYVEITF